jgi:hypothetical protein
LRALSWCRHAVAITPVGPRGAGSLALPPTSAFPIPLPGRLPRCDFRGLLGVHSRYGLPARGAAWRPFASKASAVSLPPLPLRLLPAGAKVAGWELHPLKSAALARRTRGHPPIRDKASETWLVAMAAPLRDPGRRLLFAEMTRCFRRPAHRDGPMGVRTMPQSGVFSGFPAIPVRRPRDRPGVMCARLHLHHFDEGLSPIKRTSARTSAPVADPVPRVVPYVDPGRGTYGLRRDAGAVADPLTLRGRPLGQVTMAQPVPK